MKIYVHSPSHTQDECRVHTTTDEGADLQQFTVGANGAEVLSRANWYFLDHQDRTFDPPGPYWTQIPLGGAK